MEKFEKYIIESEEIEKSFRIKKCVAAIIKDHGGASAKRRAIEGSDVEMFIEKFGFDKKNDDDEEAIEEIFEMIDEAGYNIDERW